VFGFRLRTRGAVPKAPYADYIQSYSAANANICRTQWIGGTRHFARSNQRLSKLHQSTHSESPKPETTDPLVSRS
jgi:hypothetical protein